MKVIISHDIDHLSVTEHYKDLIIPKFIARNVIDLIKGNIGFDESIKRILGLFKKGAWNNLNDLLEFDKKNEVKSTFFIAVNNGLGLSYSINQAKEAIELIKNYGFDLGIHGIEYNNFDGIQKESETFKKISELENFGIRMHYLRKDENTMKYLEKAGHIYDSTIYSENLEQPYYIGNLLEIPMHIMDTYLFSLKYNKFTLNGGIEYTKKIFENAEKEKKIVNINFHQRHFNDTFLIYKKWYEWVINYGVENNFEFINYRDILKNGYD